MSARSYSSVSSQYPAQIQDQKIRVILGLLCTIAALHFIPNRVLVVILLVLSWSILCFPLSRAEFILFIVAALFFLFQNYVCLKAGVFEFKFKDILLMPYYEPLLWGFYFLSMKRFIAGRRKEQILIDKKSISGFIVTSIVFSLFSANSYILFIATIFSTVLLFFLFHTKFDVYYAVYALVLGFTVELFGVSTGLWSYPTPDFLGIPFWFATMWISAGLLGRRFMIPAAEWFAEKLQRHPA